MKKLFKGVLITMLMCAVTCASFSGCAKKVKIYDEIPSDYKKACEEGGTVQKITYPT